VLETKRSKKSPSQGGSMWTKNTPSSRVLLLVFPTYDDNSFSLKGKGKST